MARINRPKPLVIENGTCYDLNGEITDGYHTLFKPPLFYRYEEKSEYMGEVIASGTKTEMRDKVKSLQKSNDNIVGRIEAKNEPGPRNLQIGYNFISNRGYNGNVDLKNVALEIDKFTIQGFDPRTGGTKEREIYVLTDSAITASKTKFGIRTIQSDYSKEQIVKLAEQMKSKSGYRMIVDNT